MTTDENIEHTGEIQIRSKQPAPSGAVKRDVASAKVAKEAADSKQPKK